MPTETRRYLGDKTLVHRLKLEAELRAIQAQTHESRKADLADLERQAATLQQQVEAVAQDRDRLEAEIDGKRVIEEEEYARLKAAEHHLGRLLHKVDKSPLGPVARRRPGFRAMIEQWPEPNP